MDYDGYAIGWEHALALGKYPQLNYSTDQFTNWQTQNGLNNKIQQVGGIINSVSGAGTLATSLTSMMAGGFGDGAGRDLTMGANQYVGGMLQTLGAMQQKYLASLVPPQFEGNLNSGDVFSSTEEITFRFNWMSIREERAKGIDQFFEMYGYRINRLGEIQTNTRSNWNYIKTIDINILGDIPQNDMQKLKADIKDLETPKGTDYQKGEMFGFWNTREYVLFRDGHKCKCCNGKSGDKRLNVHHIISRKYGGDAPSNLVTLCETCHNGY